MTSLEAQSDAEAIARPLTIEAVHDNQDLSRAIQMLGVKGLEGGQDIDEARILFEPSRLKGLDEDEVRVVSTALIDVIADDGKLREAAQRTARIRGVARLGLLASGVHDTTTLQSAYNHLRDDLGSRQAKRAARKLKPLLPKPKTTP